MASTSDFGGGENVCELIEQAHAGSNTASGRLLEGCRRYLLLIANDALDSGLRPKGGASDLVQDTFILAQRDFARFKGTTEQELLAWLKKILVHRVANNARSYGTDKRKVDREISLDLDAGFWRPALGEVLSGPADVALDRDEQAARLTAAVARLPKHLREVIEMRTWQQLSFPEIAARLEINSDAVRKQWARAVQRLRMELRHEL